MPKSNNEDENEVAEETKDSSSMLFLSDLISDTAADSIRKMGIIGDIAEEQTSDIIYGMVSLHSTREKEEYKDPENPDLGTETVSQPFEIIVSTNGGDAREMMAIYDTMRLLRKDCEIHTLGLGKVMSAGVPLLAAGTKGKRRIGKYCRVMLHNVSAGTVGAIQQMQNEMKEVEKIQKQYIEILAAETKMTEKDIKRIINKNVNVYLSAEEALELGIVDEVI